MVEIVVLTQAMRKVFPKVKSKVMTMVIKKAMTMAMNLGKQMLLRIVIVERKANVYS